MSGHFNAPRLDSAEYDVIVLGTGLVQTMVAAACARHGKKVLHMDHASVYGGGLSSLTLDEFSSWAAASSPSHTPPAVAHATDEQRELWCASISTWLKVGAALATPTANDKAISAEVGGDGATSSAARTSSASSEAIRSHGSGERVAEKNAADGERGTAAPCVRRALLPLIKSAQDLEFLPPCLPTAAGGAESDTATMIRPGISPPSASGAFFGASVWDPSPAVDSGGGAAAAVSSTTQVNASFPRAIPEKLGRRFNIDLCARLLFSRGDMVQLLIRCGVSRYVEFQAVNDIYLTFPEMTLAAAVGGARSGIGEEAAASNSGGDTVGELRRVPVSRTDVFKDRFIGMSEKRELMKLIRSVMPRDANSTEKEAAANDENMSFADYLEKHHSLTPRVRDVVMYGIALLRSDRTCNANVALERMKAFVRSLGQYGAGAFLCCMYGIGELPQAFARLCAVNGGIYLLRCAPECVVFQKGQFAGVILGGTRQFVRSQWLVTDLDYVPTVTGVASSAPETEKNRGGRGNSDHCDKERYVNVRSVCITDAPLPCARQGGGGGGGEEPTATSEANLTAPLSLFILPPGTASRSNDAAVVRGIQFSSSSSSCPPGYYVVHLSMLVPAGRVEGQRNGAEVALRPAIEHLFAHGERGDVAAAAGVDGGVTQHNRHQKPRVLWAAFFSLRERMPVATSLPSKCDHVLMCGDPASTEDHVSVDPCVQEAEKIFKRMYPDLLFLPEPPKAVTAGLDGGGADGDDLDALLDEDLDLSDL